MTVVVNSGKSVDGLVFALGSVVVQKLNCLTRIEGSLVSQCIINVQPVTPQI